MTVDLPCVSVWAVACLRDGDIAVGCDDAIARIFTKADDRVGAPDIVEAFNTQVQAHISARTASKVGALDKTGLPGRESLRIPGSKPGDSKLVLHGGKVEHYAVSLYEMDCHASLTCPSQWNAGNGKWEYTGEVTDAVEDQDITNFKIELDARVRLLGHLSDFTYKYHTQQLDMPHKNGDNPYLTAQK